MSRPSADPSAVARAVQERLKRAIPEPRCELDHRSPWELLVATILSAQSTDATVNKVTPELFARWPTPLALAEADPAEVEAVVRPTGFFRNKTRLIQGAARTLVAEFGGKVPQTMDDLLRVPGVARKTANVVLGVAYRVAAGIVVDTHVQRVAERLGLSGEHDPAKVERDLCALFPRRVWIDISHRLLLHGRYVCTARQPAHEACCLFEVCPSAQGQPEGTWTARAAAEAARLAAGAEDAGDGANARASPRRAAGARRARNS
ncbi:MAG TPA: endonuclease III [Planctomycetota bacterium]|nr:endonuclease III [Planctomycetota bacterium]